ncbi:hypothetical protein [Elizabethkingia meningoseptica]|uniref:hypothetical protein n=1 Tax=Elizabethkingia meningoseptica TaxID=238 RepID=UPI0023AEDA74|nr:hypothetical protein [Elizabethkingia meningoseptica]MDE5493458.1 hypothetical protein [Elizabethkingia meningoseptica]
MIKGTATGTYTGITAGIREAGKVYNAYQKGGASAAINQYGKSIYETSGAKSIVQTAKGVAKGDAESIGSAAVTIVAAVATHKAGAKSNIETKSIFVYLFAIKTAYIKKYRHYMKLLGFIKI